MPRVDDADLALFADPASVGYTGFPGVPIMAAELAQWRELAPLVRALVREVPCACDGVSGTCLRCVALTKLDALLRGEE